MTETAQRLRFDSFELTTRPFRLRRRGEDVPLQPQPARALELLASRAGEVVTREELRDHLWGEDVHLEVEPAINFTIRRVRAALGDSAQSPRFVETLPRLGYRFVMPVERLGTGTPPTARQPEVAAEVSPPPTSGRQTGRQTSLTPALLVLVAVLGLGAALILRSAPAGSPAETDAAAGEVVDKLALLPFQARADDPEAQALANVLSEELAAHLASRLAPRPGGDGEPAARGLGIVTLRASRHLTGEPPEVVGDRLGADLLLGVTLQRLDEELRLTARLWRVADRVHVWAESIDVPAGEVTGAWERITEATASAAGVALPPLTFTSLLDREEQRELWQAQVLVAQGDLEVARQAITRLEGLAGRSPRSPQARLAVADAWFSWGIMRGSPARPFSSFMPQVELWSRQALELDAELTEAWMKVAQVRFYLHQDWPAVERILEEEVLRRSPRHAAGLHLYGLYLCAIGRFEVGIDHIKKAVELDPVTLFVISDLTSAYLWARRYDEAVLQAREALALEPSSIHHSWLLIDALRLMGRLEEAEQEVVRFSAAHAVEIDGLQEAYSIAFGQYREAIRGGRSQSRGELARFAASAGLLEDALDALVEACDGKGDWLLPFVAVDPRFDPLREEPRYQALGDCLAPVVESTSRRDP